MSRSVEFQWDLTEYEWASDYGDVYWWEYHGLTDRLYVYMYICIYIYMYIHIRTSNFGVKLTGAHDKCITKSFSKQMYLVVDIKL